MYTTRTGTTRGARLRTALPALLLILCIVGGLLSSCADLTLPFRPETETTAATIPLHAIPAFSGKPYVEINGNIPFFMANELTAVSFEHYSDLDGLGRCGEAVASVGRDLMPDTDRGSIGSVKPSGWVTVKYDFVDGKYLYNRCHLIGYQLTGENANEKNLITGTRYLNTTGMLPFENAVDDYVDETGNHVLYRVTPIFEGDDLVASGVLMEAYSVEDRGALAFCVYCYNVQPGIEIDYATGESWRSGEAPVTADAAGSEEAPPEEQDLPEAAADEADGGETVCITSSGTKFHRPDCRHAKDGAETLTRAEAEARGYAPCGVCKP